ncbi:hypothetical protein SEA_GODONK_104 [Gordonia phage GodonK]|uniref:Uncharacterized protein n=1 Tax=Gordonia phage GodonK TaxID=2562192 RepID=A0A4D6E238_9CAUD|nr:hypothetical protein HOV33_gp104 [Gordonia phage GodonK]QBZ72723.1 hypothetical protein SEA_GODONK_104 [Gordonia phage GodonK]
MTSLVDVGVKDSDFVEQVNRDAGNEHMFKVLSAVALAYLRLEETGLISEHVRDIMAEETDRLGDLLGVEDDDDEAPF